MKLNLKYLRFSIIICFMIILTLLFATCKDNPVIQKKINPDTSIIYSWNSVSYNSKMSELFVADTNNIWINGIAIPLFYDGNNIQTVNMNDPNFAFRTLNGYDKNNIFLGGGFYPPISGVNPILKKWNNGNINTFIIQNDSGYHIFNILVEGQDQAWISTENSNKIYFYNTGNFSKFLMDSGVSFGTFFKDQNANLYVFGRLISSNILYSYRFVNDTFNLISKDTLGSISKKTGILCNCGKDLLMLGGNDYLESNFLFLFTGTNWEQYINTPFNIFKLGGVSKDSLYAIDYSGFLYTWNKNNWKKQDSSISPWYPTDLQYSWEIKLLNSKLYTTVNFQFGGSYLFIGKPQKN